MMIESIHTGEQIMQMKETVQEFLARGGKITMVKPMHAKGAQKKPTIKSVFRMGKMGR